MPSQVISSVENNFTKGLITEFNGLNFPENAATDCDNVEFTITGDTLRRLGVDLETNYQTSTVGRAGQAVSQYKWNNAGGDGSNQLIVIQVGNILYFYQSSSATTDVPVSARLLSSTINIDTFTASGGSFDQTIACQYSDGNGYLFVFHPSIDPVYVTYNAGSVLATVISIQIRDFYGLQDNLDVSMRPASLSAEHQYNLLNQGWTQGSPWSALSVSGTGSTWTTSTVVLNVGTVAGITLGDQVTAWSLPQYYFPGGPVQYDSKYVTVGGTVSAYADPLLTINITSCTNQPASGSSSFEFNIFAVNKGYITDWHTAEGNYPSNADVWWYFKNSSGTFDPATTQPQVSLATGNAPQGHYTVPAFNIDRSASSGISGLTAVTTSARPSTGAWFQGRVWYAGTNASQQPTGDSLYYTWSENIYFSQVCVSNSRNFGNCFQVNDPTSENLNGELPTDGGLIQIPGSGRVHKLFPIQNGLLVFAANGVWFITGSKGIGFAANDYTVNEIARGIEAISGYSFVNVNGLPYFWNEEGIYRVVPDKAGQLTVEPITVGSILSFYSAIPKSSKKYCYGAYDPINYVIQWVYKTEEETDVTDRYSFDGILNFNTYNQAFYPYTVDNTTTSINGIVYLQGPGGSDSPEPVFKYVSSYVDGSAYSVTFSDIHDDNYTDWASVSPKNYTSYFVTGYKLHGKGQNRFQTPYIYIFSRGIADVLSAYYLQGVWDYSLNPNTGRWSTQQYVEKFTNNYGMWFSRRRIRGNGIVLQIKVSSVDGKPFDIMGWSMHENVNQSV